jgi:hypothetical protein
MTHSNIPSATASTEVAGKLRDELALIVDDAVSKGDFNKVVGQFDKVNENRLGKDASANDNDLDNKVGIFLADWKAKYGNDFKLSKDEAAALDAGGIEYFQGYKDADKATMAKMMGNDMTGTPNPTTHPADMMKNTATVYIPASHGLPALLLYFVNQGSAGNDWRLVNPNITGLGELKSNLISQLTTLDGTKATWPTDENDGYRAVTHHLMMAITGNGSASSGSAR